MPPREPSTSRDPSHRAPPGRPRLDLFGSVATGAFRDDASDLDFVVAFADTTPGTYADRYLAFAEALEALFGRPVVLLTELAFRNPIFRREVDATRQTAMPMTTVVTSGCLRRPCLPSDPAVHRGHGLGWV